ncbi:MAG: TonB-dependent receptor [Gammaproteobacteria bacterium]|nr:TonB-dependent receptor [Gammaproteobacteria bacterium]
MWLSLCNVAHATGDLDSEQAFFLELPVVLTPSRLKQPIDESPSAMTVIDAQMIRASGFRKLSEIFRLVPGMYVGSQNGHAAFVSYHGTTDNYARRMQVLVDGRSVYLPPFSSVTWDNIPVLLENIERIEVVRGPSAASHGANSTQGVINIITREPSILSPDQVTVAQGGNGVSDLSAMFGITSSLMDQRLSIAYRSDKGYDWSLINDDNRTRMISWRGNYHPNVSDSIDIQLGFSDANRSEGVVGRSQSPFRDTQSSYNYQQLIWTRSLASAGEVRVNYQHSYSRFDDSQTLFPESYGAYRHDLELQHISQWHPDNRLVWGMGIRSDKVTSPHAFVVAAPTLVQTRVFAHDELRIGDAAVVNAGAMWEDDAMGHSNVSPRLSFNYHLMPNQTLRFGTSLAYRSAATVEEYGNTGPIADHPVWAQGGVLPEKMLSREIGYMGQFPNLGLTVDTRVYADHLSKMIFVDPVIIGTVYNSFKNMYQVEYKGWESTLKYQWNKSDSLIFNYARQHATCASDGLPTNLWHPAIEAGYNNLLSSCPRMVPVNSGSILVDHRLAEGLMLSGGYYFQDEVQVLDAQYVQSPMHRVDIKITRAFGKRDEVGGGEVSLVVQNLFRDSHTEYSSIPQQGSPTLDRRAYLLATFLY